MLALAQAIQRKMNEKYSLSFCSPRRGTLGNGKMPPQKTLFFQSSPNFIRWGSILEVNDLFNMHYKKTDGGRRSITSV